MPTTGTAGGEVRWEEYIELPENDEVYELVDGVLVEKPVPTMRHERIVARLIYRLSAWAEPRKAGQVLASQCPIRISDRRGAMPDVQLLSDETWRRNPTGKAIGEGRPELVVEALCPSNRSHDRVRKLGWYADIGVPEYWIVDPEAKTIERLVLADGRYVIAQAQSDGVFAPESFAGLEVPLADLFDDPAG